MKLVKAEYNEETGISTVILQNRNGQYCGSASLHPEDAAVASKYVGCDIAERRAWINYYKTEIRRTKIKLKAWAEIVGDLSYNCELYHNKVAERLIMISKKYHKHIKEMETCIELLENSIKTYIELRERILKTHPKE